jgi:hypothetical protein
MTTANPPQRRFWVVSPNVRDDYHTVGLWRQTSVLHKAAFMGYPPGDKGHKQSGYKFAHVIRPNDIVLIARRHHHHPQVVGYGVVVGPYKKTLSGLTPPESFGSLRELSPFKPLSGPPKNVNMTLALSQIAALHELHPDKRQSDRKLCDWMERQLKAGKKAGGGGARGAQTSQGGGQTGEFASLSRTRISSSNKKGGLNR